MNMFNPVSTYRIQFNKDFTFADFLENALYFSDLGITSIYASPVFEAVPGSIHGYDVTNPLRINPEVGTSEQFEQISAFLREHNMGWIQDIVPNHMAFHYSNSWLMDVLEKGRRSEYSDYFDIDFSHPELEGKIMAPFLGKPLAEVLNDNEIRVEWLNNRLVFRYYESWFPFSPESLKEIRKILDGQIEMINSDSELLGHFLDIQHYQLRYWKDSLSILNYRRFFTVNSLICLGMENDEVFEKYHAFIKQLVKGKKISGLRVDHIDGLRNPVKYLEQLRLLGGDETYIVTEKILGLEEELPFNWPVQGTSGYDYLGIVNNLFTKRNNYEILENFYREITGIIENPDELIYNSKKLILTGSMNGEWENLTRMFDESGFITYGVDGITRESVKDAIGEFLVQFPVYKLYGDFFPLPENEAAVIRSVFTKAIKKKPELEKSLMVLKNLFLDPDMSDDRKKENSMNFFLRCMQFTGPLMAKGVEDTVMYYYNCFICHNEVGDNASSHGISFDRYHELMTSRQRNWPMSMNGTSTHDTKRGEDVRARLNVISELPGEWTGKVKEWMKANSTLRTKVKGMYAPDANEEYFIYQTLAGALPFDQKIDDVFLHRMDEYLEKALREGKKNSDWNDVNEEHEKAVKDFTRNILAGGSEFLRLFLPFQKKIASFGIINSLSQLMLKATSPGIPDFYQGTELWDLSLVDPDNRRPVDYSLRAKLLAELRNTYEKDTAKLYNNLIRRREDGKIKLWMTHVLLEERKADPDLFLHGSYIPLVVEGKYSEHVFAFARVHESSWLITVVPVFVASIDTKKNEPGNINWGNTAIILPGLAPEKWFSSVAHEKLDSDGKILLSDIMKFPLPALLRSSEEKPSRFAGVLAHISSLPGKYGTGDLGNEAYDLADSLQKNGQSYWQILPFNPVGEGYSWSPYSSVSAFAGNTLFISPDLLVRSGFLNSGRIKTSFESTDRSEFNKAMEFRNMIFDEIFTNFFCNLRPYSHADFEKFCRQQEFWLHDFALFSILKREFKNVTWNEWPKKYRNRSGKSLDELVEKFESDIRKEKFLQYLFDRQWLELKKYCNNKGIRIIGDMSFYVNYDSAEVWAHPGYFSLDADKRPVSVAGVPPDYFSETGQLWNMPVYDWKRMKSDNYFWWINRIRRNMELCDVLRFDHFRAFSEYWEVPFGEDTAINGKWSPGPGEDFFRRVKQEYPDMPFIAEDLGSIDEKVYKLRDDFKLPGMTVLQFAFGDNTPRSTYIPHNFIPDCIVYTGTHDNNTTKGWYKNELAARRRQEISEYAGHEINAETCSEEFIRLAYGSVARIAVIPVQDLLGLDETARLNKPSTPENNWLWKMKPEYLGKLFPPKISRMVKLYGRI